MKARRNRFALLLVYSVAGGAFAQLPGLVSPDGVTMEACPTFSWSASPGAVGYELVAHALTALGEIDDQPALRTRIPGGALSWTPSADRCLEAGRLYLWWMRAETENGPTEWSDAAAVVVEAPPPVVELKAAMATVERYLAGFEARGSWGAEDEELRAQEVAAMGALPPESPPRIDDRSLEPRRKWVAGPAAQVGGPRPRPPPRMIVDGEIRTEDPAGSPSLWGRGREGVELYTPVLGPCTNGDISYGLSNIAVDWGSAADACPSGTRVCEIIELAPCNTGRPDSDKDAVGCNGQPIDFDADDHWGWTENRIQTLVGWAYSEGGSEPVPFTCNTLPVWCCWE